MLHVKVYSWLYVSCILINNLTLHFLLYSKFIDMLYAKYVVWSIKVAFSGGTETIQIILRITFLILLESPLKFEEFQNIFLKLIVYSVVIKELLGYVCTVWQGLTALFLKLLILLMLECWSVPKASWKSEVISSLWVKGEGQKSKKSYRQHFVSYSCFYTLW